MGIRPDQLTIKALFEQNHTFQVPKYQRGYAWEDQAVSDLVRDLERCLKRRAAGNGRSHFFGGLVTVPGNVSGAPRTNHEVIDGQQRLASIVLLIAALVHRLHKAVEGLKQKPKLSAGEKKAQVFLDNTRTSLRGTYLIYVDSIDLEYVEVPKLTLSEADGQFFQELIDGEEPVAKRASHERLDHAYREMRKFVDNQLFAGADLNTIARRIQMLIDEILVEDCIVIFMKADTRSEAYQIFQVLNDRGVQLTDGDLLRARTMELLDDKPLQDLQDNLAKAWDGILFYDATDIDDYLRWYFSSHEGKRPSSPGLADEFMADRFKASDGDTVSKTRAAAILKEAKQIDAEFARLAVLGEGEWPLAADHKTDKWDRERLRMLVSHLKHTNAMPLLLSLSLLDPDKLAQAVASIERFVFRYKIVGNAHASPMTQLYLKHSKLIRGNPTKYKIGSLRADLTELVDRSVPLKLFKTILREERFNPRGGNSQIRYLLITLEDYYAWYEKGASGVPKCRDKTRLFDFANTTLEHVYPRNPKTADKVAGLDAVKDDLGNLTIFGPRDNAKLGNSAFAQKRDALSKSNLRLNRIIGAKKTWSKSDVTARTNALVDIALKVFVP